jgi:hypothetical protein
MSPIFFDAQDNEERTLRQRDAYEKVSYLLKKLDILQKICRHSCQYR